MFDWLYKSLDAVITAPLKPRERKRDLAWSVVRKRSSNYNRVSSLLNLLDGMVPGLAEQTGRSLLKLERFPIQGYTVSLLAYGSGATVYLLESENHSERKVLKVFRRSLGKPTATALQIAQEYQEKYYRVASWFNNPYQIAIPSQYLLLHGPLLGASCAALVQPYIEGKKFDLFQDFTEDEAVQLAREDKRFHNQLIDFSQRLFTVVENSGLCFDLVGRENLMLVETGQGLQLRIADNGIFDIQRIREQSPYLHNRIQNHLEKLRTIQQRLEGLPI